MTLLDYARHFKDSGQISNLNTVWASLADDLGVHSSLVKMWAYDLRQVSAKKAIPLEKATEGYVHRSDTRPDIYPVEEYQS
ncbi:transcriptional regulator [candidate division WWE3 bacterium]|jgi:DNA-binding transcriptional regulator YdaS (Cro superfamily)|nr:transcriptional regulator [candidate division WWE3 bacterium]